MTKLQERNRAGLKLLRTGGGTRGLLSAEGHRAGQGGTLRAAVFGINDGLVSNISLVMGVAGAGTDSRFVLLAGLSGLLAGAFSMAAGEYVSMSAQREVFEAQIAFEQRELADDPQGELAELTQIYRAKGLPEAQAATLAASMMADPRIALDTHAREELGLDPDELGSPWGAAFSSFGAFVVGAIIPVIPYIIFGNPTAFWASVLLSALALFIVGVLLTTFTGRNWLYSGLRMMLIGTLAAGVTYLVGRLIGVSVTG
ncbi:MAG: VIT1/CCC1 transporter family protein [Chloroflexi bacterium]|nr:VIT1/CCC1 transporter family protein [Chloroflexota bacterium]